MRTIAWTFVDGISLLVHADVPMSDEDWKHHVADCVARLSSLRGAIIMTERQGPNARQRELVAGEPGFHTRPVAVVTPSMMVRGIVTALRWFGSEMRAFNPEDLDRALVYVDVPAASRDRIRGALVQLRRSLLDDAEPMTVHPAEQPRPAERKAALEDGQYVLTTPFAEIRAKMKDVQERMSKIGQGQP